MRIFATNQFLMKIKGFSADTRLCGAWVATSDFYKNLLRFGEFDEYNFFIPIGNERNRDYYKELTSQFNNERVKIWEISQLPLFLRDAKNLIFFNSSPGIFNIADLRSIYARRYFPVCGITHTVSNAGLLYNTFFRNMTSDLRPFDSLVCTSRMVLESVKRVHRLIRQDALAKMSVETRYKARLDCLPLGINTEDYAKNNKAESRRKLRLPVQKVIILYFGRLSFYNKADLYPLLFAFKQLLNKRHSYARRRDKNKDVLLVLAGENFQVDYSEKLKKIAYSLGISRNVKLFTNPSQKEKYSLYAASDIFVSPSDSLQESFGLTVLEAMSSGLAIVVSDWDGYKDMISHGKTGFLVPTYWSKCDQEAANSTYLFGNNLYAGRIEHLSLGQSVCIDANEMIEYLSSLVKNIDLRLKFGHNARERAVKYYDWSAVIPKYEKLWNTQMRQAKSFKAPPAGLPIFYPRYFECFSHYPSHVLNKQTPVAITNEGIRLLKTKKFPVGMPSSSLIITQMVFLILFYLREKESSNIEKIADHVNKFVAGSSSDKINYHIMWMLKYCLVEVAL